MAFNRNAHNYSTDLARIGNSMSRAMFGSAADDAAIARGKYYDAQTAGQDLKNTAMQDQQKAVANAVAGNLLPRTVANSMGFDAMNDSLIKQVMPGGPQMSVPAMGADQVNMTRGQQMGDLRAITRAGLGDLTYNPNQFASFLNSLAEGGASRLAESMILRGSDQQAQRGALLKAPQGGQFQNPDFAMNQLQTQDATNRLDDKLDQAADMNEDSLRFAPGGQGDRDTKAKGAIDKAVGMAAVNSEERFRNYASDKRLEADNYKTNVDAGVTRETERRKDSTVKWKHSNRTIEMGIEPGKQIVVDPTTAEKLGIPVINDPSSPYNGLHVLDGGQKPGDVVVKVGREDVFMDETTAEAIGATKNDDGQYVIKGAGYKEDASTRGVSGSDGDGEDTLDLTRYNGEWRDTVQFYPDFADVPNHAESAMKKSITAQIRKDMKPESAGGRGMTYTEAYAANADIMVGAGAHEVTTDGGIFGGDNFFVPKYYFDGFATGGQRNQPEGKIVSHFRSNLGYSQDQAKRVAKEIMQARKAAARG